MKGIFRYITEYGNLSFDEFPFNEVDALLFSQGLGSPDTIDDEVLKQVRKEILELTEGELDDEQSGEL